MPKVRGCEAEGQVASAQERPRGAAPCQRSGWRQRGTTLRRRSGAAAETSYRAPEVRGGGAEVAEWSRRAERSYSTFKVRRGSCEEIPLVQGKEQRLHFARATVKRYPMFKIRETEVRW